MEGRNGERAAIVVLGDVHDESDRLESTLEALQGLRPQAALLTGDIGRDPPWHRPARFEQREEHDRSMRRVVARVGGALGCPVGFVPGNHDLPDPDREIPGVNLDGRIVELGGLRVAGLGGAGPAAFGFAYEWSEAQAAARLTALFGGGAPAAVDVWLSHTPPAATTLDRTRRGQHVGSRSVREWLQTVRPRLFVCGHIHEARGFEVVDGVPCLNAGAMGEPDAQAIGWCVDWEDGPRRVRCYLRVGDETVVTEAWSS